MKINKVALLIAFAIASVLFLEVAAHADEMDQCTKITFSQAIEIPGQILPAGTYMFKLADPNDLDVVRIFNSEGTRLYATRQAITARTRQAHRRHRRCPGGTTRWQARNAPEVVLSRKHERPRTRVFQARSTTTSPRLAADDRSQANCPSWRLKKRTGIHSRAPCVW
jgi:hypothetical protein